MIKKVKTLLDVGCGASPIGDVNIDLLVPEDDSWRKVNPKLIPNLIIASAEYLPIKNKSFDIVYCSHLLEHLEHPDKVVKEILRVAKKGINLIVPTVQFGSLMMLFPYRREWCKKHHKRLYTKKSFKKFLLDETGLKYWKIAYKYIDFIRMLFDRSRPYYNITVPFPIPYEVRAEIKLLEE